MDTGYEAVTVYRGQVRTPIKSLVEANAGPGYRHVSAKAAWFEAGRREPGWIRQRRARARPQSSGFFQQI
jgi:hypothetical protein